MKVENKYKDLDLNWSDSGQCDLCNSTHNVILEVDKSHDNLISFCLECLQLSVTTGLIFHCQKQPNDIPFSELPP
jgi:hypothetical protein